VQGTVSRALAAVLHRPPTSYRPWLFVILRTLACDCSDMGNECLRSSDPDVRAANPGSPTGSTPSERRVEALAEDKLAKPRQRGARETLRILLTTREEALKARTQGMCQLHALVVGAPDVLRSRFRHLTTDKLVRRCSQLRRRPGQCLELKVTSGGLRSVARRAEALRTEAAACEQELAQLVDDLAPSLTAEPGVGPIFAAQIICAWSHRGRVRSDAAFAVLAGVAPIPASSGQVVRHRLNRALHTIVIWRTNHHAEIKHYMIRRRTEGKSDRGIPSCLKRHLARRIFKLLQRVDSR
jgi:transposase